MNDLQKTELEILKVFIELCERLGLRYYLVCGTALGAVKYKGFIPWDDDMDVALPRGDYERFLAEAPALLPEYLFLQNYRSDPQFPYAFSKLRNSETTLIETGTKHLNINQGIYIDIFPLDGHPSGKLKKSVFELKRKLYTWQQFCALGDSPSKKVHIRNKIFRALGYHKKTAKSLRKLEALYSLYPPETSGIWCNYGNWQGKLEYAPRGQYEEGTKAVFEGVEAVIPKNYDAYLTQKYGEWRKDPPPEKQVSHHKIVKCDVSKSYREYL